MATFSSNIADTGHHGHSFLIYTNIEYLALGCTVAIVPSTKPLAYIGLATADKYIYEEEKATYAPYKRYLDAIKQVII